MLHSLHIFCDLLKTESFTETAKRNYITQSAVSHHIKSLEEKFGHQLIIRSRRSVHLTNAGKTLYAAGMDILTRYEQLERALKSAPNEISGPLRIATTIAVGLHELPAYSTFFVKKHPQVEVKLAYLKGPEIYESVLNFQADLGLLAFPRAHPLLKIQIFKKDSLVIIAPPSYSQDNSGRIDFPRLFEKSFIALDKGLPTRKAIDSVLSELQIRPNITHVFDDIESIKQAVKVGLGISIIPKGTVLEEIKSRKLKQIEIPGKRCECPLACITRKNSEISPVAQAFISLLLSQKS